MFDLNEIKKALAHYRCKEHKKYARINIDGRTIDIKTCCNSFDLIMDSKLEEQLSIHADKKLQETLNHKKPSGV